MKKFLPFISVITFSLISCKNEPETKEIPKVVVPFYQVANQQQTVTTPQPSQNPLYQENSNQPQTPQVTKGTNPAHGQPGHRCDIPVGAPMTTTTKTTNQANSAVVSNTNISVPTPVATTTKNAKGMNPAHGQPGHRCDIPVGAPLNSPIPTKTATSQTVTNTKANTTSETIVTTPDGKNPPHGQPGHRCDIAVGAPLNAPVATKPAASTTDTNTSVIVPATNATPIVTPAQ